MSRFTRRQILAAAPFVAAAAAAPARLPIRKAVEFSMLPGKIPVLDRFQMARDAGFEAIECPTMPDAAAAEEVLSASRKTQLPIHPVMNQEHWWSPLSSADPAVEKSMEGAHPTAQRQTLGRRHRAAGTRRGQSRDFVRPGVGRSGRSAN
jgi:hexulose-6-phosphate isomerase